VESTLVSQEEVVSALVGVDGVLAGVVLDRASCVSFIVSVVVALVDAGGVTEGCGGADDIKVRVLSLTSEVLLVDNLLSRVVGCCTTPTH
jgi:hypothetical protein